MTSTVHIDTRPEVILASMQEAERPCQIGPGAIRCASTTPHELRGMLQGLRDEHGFADLELLTAEELHPAASDETDTAGVDNADEAAGDIRSAGVRMVYALTRRTDRTTMVIHVDVADGALTVPSVASLWSGAAPLEREVYDLFGVEFTEHPALCRIVLRDDFEGHPLRKGFALDGSGVSADTARTAVKSHGDAHLLADGTASAALIPGLPPESLPSAHPGFQTERIVVHMGPQHPSTHGVLHLWLVLDGETVVAAQPTQGYLHRCIEKLAESRDYRACTALLDRCDYVSGFHTELAHVLAVEELCGIEPTPKADYLRVAMSELVRITSHHTWYAAAGLDAGALTPFLYAFIDRELIVDFFEEVTGGRMMFNYFRPGGVKDDLPAGAAARMIEYLRGFDRSVDDYEALLTGNEIFRARTRGIGFLSRATIRDYCVTGPMARASGVDIDLRRDRPYAAYDRLPVNVMLGETGDTFDRYLVRVAEMRESARLALAALEGLPEGPHIAEGVPRVIKPPKGASYRAVESPRGELGVYLVSDGSAHPWRLKVRSPTFSNIHAAGPLCAGLRLADVAPVVGSIDIVMGEIDR
ncbi:MAG: NADH-quinone oxidoreductase subunit C [Coriobacteriia bacterium]|nr:NADH-quinone oxidoreductase subunit C [Coriobacteriia bacterium]